MERKRRTKKLEPRLTSPRGCRFGGLFRYRFDVQADAAVPGIRCDALSEHLLEFFDLAECFWPCNRVVAKGRFGVGFRGFPGIWQAAELKRDPVGVKT